MRGHLSTLGPDGLSPSPAPRAFQEGLAPCSPARTVPGGEGAEPQPLTQAGTCLRGRRAAMGQALFSAGSDFFFFNISNFY